MNCTLINLFSYVFKFFDVDRAIYFPGSSKIQNSREVLRYCFENFLWEKQNESDAISPIFSIDEVVGGHSVERVINAYNQSVRRVAKENLKETERRKEDIEGVAYDLSCQFPLTIFGIRDMGHLGRNMNRKYLELSNHSNPNRMIYEFPVLKIITMDDLDYELVKFQHPSSKGWTSEGGGYYPKIDSLVVSRHYMDLLHDVARLIGVNPEMVDPSRARIRTYCEEISKKPKYD